MPTKLDQLGTMDRFRLPDNKTIGCIRGLGATVHAATPVAFALTRQGN